MNTKLLLLFAFGAAASTQFLNAQVEPQEIRDVLDQWVETRQIISKEQSEWRVEKAILGDTKVLLSSELDRLNKELEEMELTATEADEERSELTAEKDNLEAAANVIGKKIIDLEIQLKEIIARLPQPLLESIQPIIARLPKDSYNTESTQGERVQNLVATLDQADKFNKNFKLTSESRELSSGKVVEVTTLYWGLAIAFFVDAGGEYAGLGTPTMEGWQWDEVEGAGVKIKQLLDIYEGLGKIEFVEVPAKIK
ncbi:MAG: DUF3450 family protein [Verrucomicrobiota bacterium]